MPILALLAALLCSFVSAENLFEKENTAYTFLFRTDFGSMEGASLFPAAMMLVDSTAVMGDWELEASLMMQGQSDFSDTGVGINQLSATWYRGDGELRVGRFVSFVGVMDHLSVVNLLNPVRAAFFDDPDPDIRRIPQWMAEGVFHYEERATLRLFVEPFDRRYQDYTSTYLSLALDTLMPKLLAGYKLGDETLDAIKEQIFLPAYRGAIAPAVKNGVNDYYDFADFTLDKTLVGFDAAWTGESATLGVAWFNKYSEVPYIEIDRHILDIIQDTENGWQYLKEYLKQNDLSLVKSVEGFRYNQLLLYGESSVGDYGARAEAFWRDKMPFLDGYSVFVGVGVGIDRNGDTYYNDLEVQWMRLDRSGENLFALLWACRHIPFRMGSVDVTLENYSMLGAMEGELQVSFLPTVTLGFHDRLQLQLQYLIYPDDPQYDTFVTTLGARF
ncbi:hypothetical protein [Hydrogenimonas sp.]